MRVKERNIVGDGTEERKKKFVRERDVMKMGGRKKREGGGGEV